MIPILSIVALIISLTIHEFAHALVADKLGDPTPRANGRLTLNPLAHLDPLGTLALIFFHFGWGKPVPIDPYNLRNPRRDEVFIAAAGPISNLLIAATISLFYHFLPLIPEFVFTIVAVNITLALFNLIPLSPLDGSKIHHNLIPFDSSTAWEEALTRYSLPLMLVLLFLPFGGSNIITSLLQPATLFLTRILLIGP